jgi:hypothetical protein
MTGPKTGMTMPPTEAGFAPEGGARIGAGRKPAKSHITKAGKLFKRLKLAAKTWEAERGKSVADMLMELIYEKTENQPQIRLGAIKLYYDLLIRSQQASESTNVGVIVTSVQDRPGIALPPLRPELRVINE